MTTRRLSVHALGLGSGALDAPLSAEGPGI